MVDLLTRVAALAVATLTAGAALAGCTSDGDAAAPSATEATPAADLVALDPVRPDEVPTGEQAGAGSEADVVRGVSADVVLVYAVCRSPGDTMDLTVSLPRPEVLTVACDGVPTRAQVFTQPGDRFGLDVAAPDGVDWKVLVTGRDERGR